MPRNCHRLFCGGVGRVELELPGIDDHSTARHDVGQGTGVSVVGTLAATSPKMRRVAAEQHHRLATTHERLLSLSSTFPIHTDRVIGGACN